ncbi:MAG: hypothetical protein IJJ04_04050 [Clostridia bacterium]|nr:hypothetical protein [Clostridia bacterium]
MFFNTPPDINNFHDISISEYSNSISETPESPKESPAPLSELTLNKTYKLSPYSIDVPLTRENLKKHNELMNKERLKFTDINNIKDKKILDDFNSQITLKQLSQFAKYFVNKKNLPEIKKNNLIFIIFIEVLNLRKRPFLFNKKELISTCIYMDRIYEEFNDFEQLTNLYRSNPDEYIYCQKLTLYMGLLKAGNVYNKKDFIKNHINGNKIYKKVDEAIGDDIFYGEYKWYSENIFS